MELATIAVVLFDDFETLDAMGPIEVFGCQKECQLRFISREGGIIRSYQGVKVITEQAEGINIDALLVPGGMGTRVLTTETAYLDWLRDLVARSRLCMSVCTGSALLASASTLNGIRATSNKQAFDWVASLNGQVQWQSQARWVHDGKFYTSSGISAGVDMALQVVADIYGQKRAEETATKMEYLWNKEANNDPFSLSQR
ncbi:MULTISPECIES: DJ-1/PfpI family protein [Tenebrionibacter/Tenebrionicola group]|uniref:DJ-1/PfpI family protein n=1 Tax=Tenebrionibacter/Tenebrionicola group TaxID=2969848 RepID=UPI001EE8291A|nr:MULTISPECIES: DJ-1/PfpI family protein [Tenebrionibacter/Tenebrionicola group]